MADVMILFGSGGHSTEMLMLMQNADLARLLDCDNQINRLVCVISEDDELVEEKILPEFQYCEHRDRLQVVHLQRARKVGQSYLTSIWTTVVGILSSISLVLRHKPSLCLTNGPGISVTMSLAIRLLQLLTLGTKFRCDILYVESFCRTQTLSLSGKIIYHLRLADEFYVQWPLLATKYPRAKYKGVMV